MASTTTTTTQDWPIVREFVLYKCLSIHQSISYSNDNTMMLQFFNDNKMKKKIN